METVILECGHSANATDGNGQPACAIHSTAQGGTTFASAEFDLTGRQARCGCGSLVPSSTGLAFFQYRGEGSRPALTLCGICSYADVVHNPINPSTGRAGITEHEFEARGAYENDEFYCGCRGWD